MTDLIGNLSRLASPAAPPPLGRGGATPVTALAVVAQLPVLLVVVSWWRWPALRRLRGILDVDLRPPETLRDRRSRFSSGEGHSGRAGLAVAALGRPCVLAFVALDSWWRGSPGVTLLWVIGPIAGAGAFASPSPAGRPAVAAHGTGVPRQLRNLRDRMAVSNQSLDTALQELGRNPGPTSALYWPRWPAGFHDHQRRRDGRPSTLPDRRAGGRSADSGHAAGAPTS